MHNSNFASEGTIAKVRVQTGQGILIRDRKRILMMTSAVDVLVPFPRQRKEWRTEGEI